MMNNIKFLIVFILFDVVHVYYFTCFKLEATA